MGPNREGAARAHPQSQKHRRSTAWAHYLRARLISVFAVACAGGCSGSAAGTDINVPAGGNQTLVRGSTQAPATQQPQGEELRGIRETPAMARLAPMQHAFAVLGDETTFLVHMTNMWMEPHMYQCVLRVRIPDSVKRDYEADRQAHPGQWYIVGNTADDPLVLPDIARGAKTSFHGAIWRGFPETPGAKDWPWSKTPPVVEGFEVEIEATVYYRRFDFNLRRPSSLTYVLFGKGDEAHMQSYQTKQPDFDHMLTLKERPSWLAPELLETGVHVNFPEISATPKQGKQQSFDEVYCTPPVDGGTHSVQLSGHGPERPLAIANSVFFGTFPVNEKDPCQAESAPGPATDS